MHTDEDVSHRISFQSSELKRGSNETELAVCIPLLIGEVFRETSCPLQREGQEMRFRKTPQARRTTYREYDEEGNVIFEMRPDYGGGDTDITIREENRRTIKALHAIDDSEVYYNVKGWKLPPEELEKIRAAREKARQAFHERYGYDPDPEYLDERAGKLGMTFEPVDDTPGDSGEADYHDKSSRQRSLSIDPFADEDSPASVAAELIASGSEFSDRERQLYDLLFLQEMSKQDAAAALGISGARVSQILKEMYRKLMEHAEYANYFR